MRRLSAAFCLSLLSSFFSVTYADEASDFQLYQTGNDYYLKSQPEWVPIAGQITFFIPTYDEGDILKLTDSNGWMAEYISYSDFVAASPALIDQGAISFEDVNNDGIADISVTVGGELIQLLGDSNEYWSVNNAPVIDGLVNVSVTEDGSFTQSFEITDAEQATSELTVSFSSSNTSLIPNSNINLTNNNQSYTISGNPTSNQSGNSTITVTVDDGLQTSTNSFVVTVLSENDAPTISNITNKTIDENGTLSTSFTIGDVETSASSLTVSATSNAPTLIENLTVSGSGSTRTLDVEPFSNKNGTATITLTVSDGNKNAQESFSLTVDPLIAPETPTTPSLSGLPGEDTTSTRVATLSGEFRVDESGSATYSLPIATPVGAGGVSPHVALTYNSSAGHGSMGIGWSLQAVSSISRCRQTFETDSANVSLGLDSADRFCLDGQRLIVVSGVYGSAGSEYRTEIESQSRIKAIGTSGNGPSYFTVERPDGSTTTYGYTSSSKLESSDGTAISWLINETSDNMGNLITYNYLNGTVDSVGENEILLSSISYSGNEISFHYDSNDSNPALMARYGFIEGVRVEKTARLDEISVTIDAKVTTNYELTYESVALAAEDEIGATPLRLLEIKQCNGGSVCKKPVTFDWNSSELSVSGAQYDIIDYSSVTGSYYTTVPFDANGDGYSDLLYVSKSGNDHYIYVAYNNADRTFGPLTAITESYISGDQFEIFPIDVDGDSAPELVMTYGSVGITPKWKYYDLEQTTLVDMGQFVTESDSPYKWLDINADALPDLIYYKNSNEISIHVNDVGSLENAKDTTAYVATNSCLGVGKIIIPDDFSAIDYNGDGRSDINAIVEISCYDNRGLESRKYFWSPFEIEHDEATDSYQLNPLLDESEYILSDTADNYAIRNGDVNGDGLADIVSYSKANEKWELYISNGQQLQAAHENVITYSNGTSIPKDVISSLVLIDINEDGLSDLVYQNTTNGYWYYHKSNGTQFSEPIYLYWNTYNETRYVSQLASFDGDSDLDYLRVDLDDEDITLYHGSYGPLATRNIISKINYGYDLTTEITYDRLTNPNVYQMGDGAEAFIYGNGSPVFEIIAPMTVVASVESSAPGYVDGSYSATNTVTVEYEYEGLRMQAGGRGTLGFKKLQTYDPQTDVTSETVYRQDFPFIGMPIATIKYLGSDTTGLEEDGTHNLASSRVLSYAVNTYDAEYFNSDTTVFPYVKVSEEQQYSLSDDGLSTEKISTIITTNTYTESNSNHANLTKSVVETRDSANALIGKVTTTNTYNSEDVSSWLLGRITSAQTQHYYVDAYPSGVTTLTRNVTFEYYNSGPELGMLKYERIEPNGGTQKALTTLHCYDNYGNEDETITYSGTASKGCGATSVETANLGDSTAPYDVFRRSTATYDSDGIYANSSGNDKFSITLSVLDRNDLGQVTESVDIDGVVTRQAYDSFGNLYASSNSTGGYSEIKMRAAGNEIAGTPVISEEYSVVQRTQSDGAPTIFKYFDELGREVATVKQGFATNSWIHQYVRYDTYSRPVYQSIPKLVNGTSAASINWSTEATATEYDNFGRVQSVLAPDGTETDINYDGLSTTTSTTFDSITDGTQTQSKTETKNVQGHLVAVTDALTTMTYSYDPTGNLTLVEDSDGVQIKTEFDSLGRKTKTIDPDKGTWTYTYNPLGELATQTDAIGTTTLFYRDTVGRTVLRDVSNGDDTYYVFSGHKLDTECVYNGSGCNNSKPDRLYEYDSFGRVSTVWFTLDGNSYVQTTTYDQYGRVFQQFDASGSFQGIRNHYNSNGYLYKQVEARNSSTTNATVYYEILEMNANGSVTKFKQNDGKIQTNQSYDEALGTLKTIQTYDAANVMIQNNEYEFDGIGNLRKRYRHTLTDSRKSEEFQYDDLNRLTHVNGVEKVEYYNNGNIYKKDGELYCYDPARPHAVTGVGNCNSPYQYDANGNMTSGRGLSITYTTFDKVSSITSASGTTNFEYDTQRNRFKRTTNEDGVLVETYYVGSVEFVFNNGVFKETRRYINGAISTQFSSGVTNVSYLHKDHLGSIDSVTNESGKLVQKLYFDAWGNKSQVAKENWIATVQNAAATSLVDILQLTPRGFTGHEHIDHANIIHMNGRIYDPTLGRFLQADPHIQAPKNSQSYNRYAYVLNNPLSYTDPSGYFFKKIGKFVKKYWKVIVAVAVTYFTAGAASGWAASWGFAAGTVGNAVVAGTIAGATGGFVGGALMTGSLRGALRGAFTGAIAGAAGGYANFGSVSGWGDAAKRVGVAALGGCASGKASGGSCGKGARLAAYAQMIALSVDHMTRATNEYKLKSCGKAGSVCNYNDKGELLTDGGRGAQQIEGTSPGDGNFLTRNGMASEGSGQHLYNENSLLGRYVNKISKTHDYFNSDISKLFGFQGYDSATGLWLSGTESYNTMYQLYSFAGMLPAGIYTSAALLAPYPIYQYDELRRNN